MGIAIGVIIGIVLIIVLFRLLIFLLTNDYTSRIISIIASIVSLVNASKLNGELEEGAGASIMVTYFIATVIASVFFLGPIIFDKELDGYTLGDDGVWRESYTGGFIMNTIICGAIVFVSMLIAGEYGWMYYLLPLILLIVETIALFLVFKNR